MGCDQSCYVSVIINLLMFFFFLSYVALVLLPQVMQQQPLNELGI